MFKEGQENSFFGFTLIELLIVISIIGLLSTLSLFALSGARESARDAKRKADLEEIRSALELYKADCNNYPSSLPSPGSSLTANCTGTVNTYLKKVPGDPSTGAAYPYGLSGTSYVICSHLENSSGSVSGCPSSCNPSPCRYQVSGP